MKAYNALDNSVYIVKNPIGIGLNITPSSIDMHSTIINDSIKYFNNTEISYRNWTPSYSRYYSNNTRS